MKKAIYTLGILALAALAFASCQKQPLPGEENTPGGKLVTVTFVANNPGTKTGILEEGETSVSYKWTEDAVRLYTVSESGLTEITNLTRSFSEDGSQLSITATVEEGSTVRAIFAYTFGRNNENVAYMYSSSTQAPSNTSVDRNADVLVSEDEVGTAGRTEFSLIFHRQVAINKMTLHGLHEGEKIRRVLISSSDASKFLVGGSPLAGNNWEGQGSLVTINYMADYEAVNEGGDYVFPVYFTTLPVEDVPLHLIVYTDKYVYEKDLNGTVSFNLGQFTKFNVGLPEGTSPVVEPYTWFMAEGDLTSQLGILILDKGTPATSWLALWLESSSSPYGWNPQKGIQIGSEDSPCAKFMLITTSFSGYLESIRVNFSSDDPSGISMEMSVYDGNLPLLCGGATSVSGTTGSAYYTFTSTDLLLGQVYITIHNTSGKAFYIKSVEFNPEFSRGTAGQDDTVNAYNTGF